MYINFLCPRGREESRLIKSRPSSKLQYMKENTKVIKDRQLTLSKIGPV